MFLQEFFNAFTHQSLKQAENALNAYAPCMACNVHALNIVSRDCS